MSTTGHTESGIEQLLRAEIELHPPKFLVEQARLRDYAAEYKRSVEEPDVFWDAVAKELEWFRPWKKVFDWTYPTFEWFQGGKCNIAYNALDRPGEIRAQEQSRLHLDHGRRHGTAAHLQPGFWTPSATRPTASNHWA